MENIYLYKDLSVEAQKSAVREVFLAEKKDPKSRNEFIDNDTENMKILFAEKMKEHGVEVQGVSYDSTVELLPSRFAVNSMETFYQKELTENEHKRLNAVLAQSDVVHYRIFDKACSGISFEIEIRFHSSAFPDSIEMARFIVTYAEEEMRKGKYRFPLLLEKKLSLQEAAETYKDYREVRLAILDDVKPKINSIFEEIKKEVESVLLIEQKRLHQPDFYATEYAKSSHPRSHHYHFDKNGLIVK